MGIFFRSRRRRGGGTFTLLLLGAGIMVSAPWLARHGEALQTSCMNKAQAIGGYGSRICNGIGRLSASLDLGLGGAGGSLKDRWQERLNDWRVSVDNSNIREKIRSVRAQFDERLSSSLSSYVSNDTVKSLLSGGGSGSFGASPNGQLSGALSSLVAGQKLLHGGGGISADPAAAIDVYKQGAGVGAYGLIPQLELGSLYSQGGFGVSPDAGLAAQYQSQALDSLRALRGSNTPEAQSLLQGLNIDPQALQQQLEEALARLKQGN